MSECAEVEAEMRTLLASAGDARETLAEVGRSALGDPQFNVAGRLRAGLRHCWE